MTSTTMMQLFTSAQRRTGETTSDFQNDFNPPRALEGKKLVFRMAQISNAIFNITSSDILNVGALVIPMIPGTYDGVKCGSMIKAQIDAVMGPPLVTVSFNSNTIKMTITFDVAWGVQVLGFATGVSAGPNNRLWKVLGFTSADGLSAVDSPAALSHTSPYPCSFGLPVSLYIHIAINGEEHEPIEIGGGNLNRRCSMVFPLTTTRGAMDRLTQDEITLEIMPRDRYIKTARFRVTDETGVAVTLNNADWWMLFDIKDV